VYLWFRFLAAGEAVARFLFAPYRWVWRRLEYAWFRLKPWLARHKRRLIWTAVALMLLGLAGGYGSVLPVARLVPHAADAAGTICPARA
jgi:hypothetical protein